MEKLGALSISEAAYFKCEPDECQVLRVQYEKLTLNIVVEVNERSTDLLFA